MSVALAGVLSIDDPPSNVTNRNLKGFDQDEFQLHCDPCTREIDQTSKAAKGKLLTFDSMVYDTSEVG